MGVRFPLGADFSRLVPYLNMTNTAEPMTRRRSAVPTAALLALAAGLAAAGTGKKNDRPLMVVHYMDGRQERLGAPDIGTSFAQAAIFYDVDGQFYLRVRDASGPLKAREMKAEYGISAAKIKGISLKLISKFKDVVRDNWGKTVYDRGEKGFCPLYDAVVSLRNGKTIRTRLGLTGMSGNPDGAGEDPKKRSVIELCGNEAAWRIDRLAFEPAD
jgi:hypothetical protein